LPRFAFYAVPEEQKPLYVDFSSPIFVESFRRIVRKASRLTVTEMLPTHDQCWLADSAGERYTSELRAALVDPRPWRPPELLTS
jgi:hypothetical protein